MNNRVRLIDRLSSGQDHIVFAVMFAIGTIWVLMTRVAFNAGVFWATLVPISILFFYAWILWQPQYRLREDRAGDNLYYLGFLFTVVSLGIALYRYDGKGDNVDSIINDSSCALAVCKERSAKTNSVYAVKNFCILNNNFKSALF